MDLLAEILSTPDRAITALVSFVAVSVLATPAIVMTLFAAYWYRSRRDATLEDSSHHAGEDWVSRQEMNVFQSAMRKEHGAMTVKTFELERSLTERVAALEARLEEVATRELRETPSRKRK